MVYQWEESLTTLLNDSLQKRLLQVNDQNTQAFRLLNGFTEGFPFLSVDLFGKTIVLFIHKLVGDEAETLIQASRDFYLMALPFVKCVVAKQRSAHDSRLKQGEMVFGTVPDTQISEDGIAYAIDLLMNQDASFYLDTSNLRAWLKRYAKDKDVLNTFAYTGSLGVAALAGGASRVVQIDRNKKFLDLAKKSVELNQLESGKIKSIAVDFFVAVGQMKTRQESFDIVILDPPFFSITEKGKVDQGSESVRLINKARPLVRDGGYLVVVNNALFLSGALFIDSLQQICSNGYLSIEELIPVREDVAVYGGGQQSGWPVNPAPFNHPTKIVVMRVKKKTPKA